MATPQISLCEQVYDQRRCGNGVPILREEFSGAVSFASWAAATPWLRFRIRPLKSSNVRNGAWHARPLSGPAYCYLLEYDVPRVRTPVAAVKGLVMSNKEQHVKGFLSGFCPVSCV